MAEQKPPRPRPARPPARPTRPPLKPFILSNNEYRRMKEAGIRSWNERTGDSPIPADLERFLADALSLDWVAKAGKAIELGCGTGPIARWLADRGWSATGVDISPTAVQMARAQADDRDVTFFVGDVTNLIRIPDAAFDLAVDGLCFHFITEPADRAAFLSEARRILRPGGCFVLLSMALPVLPEASKRLPGPIRDGTVLFKAEDGPRYEGAVELDGEWHVPVAKLEPWQDLLKALEQAGLEPLLFRVALCRPEDTISFLTVAARRRNSV